MCKDVSPLPEPHWVYSRCVNDQQYYWQNRGPQNPILLRAPWRLGPALASSPHMFQCAMTLLLVHLFCFLLWSEPLQTWNIREELWGSSDLNIFQRTPTFPKLFSVSRWTYFMPEIRSRFKKKKKNFPFKSRLSITIWSMPDLLRSQHLLIFPAYNTYNSKTEY